MLFGRTEQVNRLVDAADQTVETGAQMAIVSGEAGIGKSSLAHETLAQLEANGWATHVGYCVEYADRPMPFGSIVSILRSVLLTHLDETDGLLRGRREDLAGLLPELASDGDDRSSLAGDVDRLFDAIAAVLREASVRRPCALLIEDIHWADASTRDLITLLVRNLGRARVLLLVTERTGATPRSHPLRIWVAEHGRLPNVHVLALEGLGRDDLAQQAEGVLQRTPEPELVDELVGRTGGNPYFASELLAARRDGDAALPTSLVDFLTSRLDRLGPDEREVLRAIAVAGGSADHPLLVEMLPGLPVGDLVRALFDRHILLVEGSDYTFRHALLREAILRDVLPFEAQELHRRAAEAIEADPQRGDSLSDLVSLALHWAEASDPDRSLGAAVAAAHAAAGVAAYESAAAMAVQALDAWPTAERPEEIAGLRRDQLLLEATEWLASCYRSDEAVASVEAALAGWARDLPTERKALLLAQLAPIHWDLGNPPEAGRVLAEAAALLPDEASAEAAQVHHRLSKQAVAEGQIGPARNAAEKAIAIAESEGPRVVLVEAMTTKALAVGVTGDLAGGLALAAEARALALENGLVSEVANTYRTEMLIINDQAGRTEACLAASRDGLAYAERHCGPRWRANFRLDLCLGYVEGGRLNVALPLLEELVASEIDDFRRLMVLQTAGLYAMHVDDLAVAAAFLADATEIASRYQSAQETGAQSKLLAELARREGRLSDAASLIDEALAFQLAEDNLSYTRESIVEKIRIAGAMGEAGHPDAAAVLAEAGQLSDQFAGTGRANEAFKALMELELAAAEGTVDAKAGMTTVEALTEIGWLIEAAEARLLLIAHRQAIGDDRAELAAEITTLDELATEHGMRSVRSRLAGLARAARIPLVEVDEPPDAAEAPAYPHHLTTREVEVMSLLAEGLTNKAIGERLFVSHRTVSTHISNLLAKLGVSTRGEAAAAYHRLGLAEVIDLREPGTVSQPTG